jgi:hypothetical protein
MHAGHGPWGCHTAHDTFMHISINTKNVGSTTISCLQYIPDPTRVPYSPDPTQLPSVRAQHAKAKTA